MFLISKLLLTPLLWGEASFCHILQPARGGRSLLLLFFLFLFLLLSFKIFISLELVLLLPAADDFEKQCLLYFLLSDWPVQEGGVNTPDWADPMIIAIMTSRRKKRKCRKVSKMASSSFIKATIWSEVLHSLERQIVLILC